MPTHTHTQFGTWYRDSDLVLSVIGRTPLPFQLKNKKGSVMTQSL